MLLRHANKKKIFTLMTVGVLLYAYIDKLKSILLINILHEQYVEDITYILFTRTFSYLIQFSYNIPLH